MKIEVITRHAVSNYGSLLQTIATQIIIEQLGYSCEIINYIRKDESCWRHEKTILTQKAFWNKSPFRKIVYLMLRQPESVMAGLWFQKERSKYLKLSHKYVSAEQLKRDKPYADVYMTGSDQVWGPVGNGEYDDIYCLSFTGEQDKRISYASSFGHTGFTGDMKKYFEKWLSKYDHISVREDTATEILHQININSLQVLDPTLLLNEKSWQPIMESVPYKNYILIYQIHNNKTLGEYAKKVAQRNGLKLIRISAVFHQRFQSGKFVWLPNIGQFLGYIKNAKCLFTDSFHGMAFAVNFNTSFVGFLPDNNTETRISSMLNLTNLSHRIFCGDEKLDAALETIDFSEANSILEKKRQESLQILKKMIEQ